MRERGRERGRKEGGRNGGGEGERGRDTQDKDVDYNLVPTYHNISV